MFVLYLMLQCLCCPAGQVNINFHLSYRGFSGSDSSWDMYTQEHWRQQCLLLGWNLCPGIAAVPKRNQSLPLHPVWMNLHMATNILCRERLRASYAISWQPNKKFAEPVFPSRNYVLLLYARVRNSPCESYKVKSRGQWETKNFLYLPKSFVILARLPCPWFSWGR